MDAVNTFQVFDGLWTSGMLSERDVQALPGLGFTVLINLALPSSPNALAGEGDLAANLGLTYIHIPVVWESPCAEQFFQFARLLKGLAGEKVWVHCAMNMRVSAFVYLYRRLVLREDEETASQPMRQIWTPNETWQAFLDEVCRKYQE
jgi:protein tyrosine phosphatase (PTP) superfamily phosphohydrolase (DUF442 family)